MRKKKSELEKYKLKYEKTKFKLSPFAGKQKSFLVRAFNNTKTAVVRFTKETYNAINIILRGIF